MRKVYRANNSLSIHMRPQILLAPSFVRTLLRPLRIQANMRKISVSVHPPIGLAPRGQAIHESIVRQFDMRQMFV